MARQDFRVTIPNNPDEMFDLIDLILKKHDADGANSLLKQTEVDALTNIRTTNAPKRRQWKQLRKDAETLNGEMAFALGLTKGQGVNTQGTGLYFVTKMRDHLLNEFKGTPKSIGGWGFTVDDSPKAKAKTPPAAK